MKSAISSVSIHEGGVVFTKNVQPFQSLIVDTFNIEEIYSVQWKIHIKASTKYFGFEMSAIKKYNEMDATMYGILGDNLDMLAEVIVDSNNNASLQITNNEPYTMIVRGKRIQL